MALLRITLTQKQSLTTGKDLLESETYSSGYCPGFTPGSLLISSEIGVKTKIRGEGRKVLVVKRCWEDIEVAFSKLAQISCWSKRYRVSADVEREDADRRARDAQRAVSRTASNLSLANTRVGAREVRWVR